ncbi:MAG TPA: SH3 domain-containing protein [Methylomirabilota bacterium]|nr:SH3 domain-containing protein [Methylomirabilota bacterium]
MMTLLKRLLPAVALFATLIATTFAQGVRPGSDSALPVPRFVSLKSDAVNVRRGPSREHEVVWRYVRSGLPVEVTQEFENWRRIRDFEGSEGWVFHSLLSGTRTVLIAPWDKSDRRYELKADASPSARITAYAAPGVQARVPVCRDGWCRLDGQGFSGWIEQGTLWGVYPDETLN